MSWHTDQLKYALGLSGLVTFYGLVTIIIFVGGKYLNVSLSYQIVVVALVLLTLPFALVIGFVQARKQKKREALAKAKEEEEKNAAAAVEGANGASAPQKAVAPAGRYEELNQSANTAFQFLQSSNLAGDAKGKDAIYALPFFLFAGGPRSGKSSLVLSSNFNFQTLPNQRQSEQNFLRPTRAADWRVTSEAVLIDTAGRYQTEGEYDADEWTALLEILKKQRAMRPFDGLVLVVNTEKILHADEAEIEHQAKLLRARLDDAMQRAKIKFPVYLVFSNADAIEGFRDSFSVSQREGKNLLLGATFPLDKADSAHALFDAEFEALQNGLLGRRLLRLSAPFPPVRQIRIFNFPVHFTAARRKLGHFVGALFRPNPFSESPLFRGFYFTANLPNNNTIGASYFSERFFRDVLLRDKNLVANFQAQKQRPPVLGWVLLSFGTILTVFLLAMTGVSAYLNKQLLDDATERGLRVRQMNDRDANNDKRNPLEKDATEKAADLATLDNLRVKLKELDDYNRNNPPFYLRFGMYSGDKLFLGDPQNKGLFGIYADAVEQRFKKPMLAELTGDLQKFTQSNVISGVPNEEQEKELERYYKLLKAYLMLTKDYKGKAESTFLNEQLKPYWKEFSKNAPGTEDLSEQQLAFFASQVDRPQFEAIMLDKDLVSAVQQRLKALPAWVKQYNNIISDVNKKVEPIGLNEALRGNSKAVYLESNYKVPGSFTETGYKSEIYNAIRGASGILSEPDWVMGETESNPKATEEDIKRLKNRYFNEYSEQWRKFVQSVKVVPYKNDKAQAETALEAFGSADSPFNALILEIVRNTNLAAPPTGWWSQITSFFDGSADAAKMAEGTAVVTEFKPLVTFSQPPPNKPEDADKTGLSIYKRELNNLVGKLKNFSQDQLAKDLTKEKPEFDLPARERSISDPLKGLDEKTASKEVAELLKQPIEELKIVFGKDVKSEIERGWKNQLFPTASALEKGFPFGDAGEADLKELNKYLNGTNGALTVFFEKTLKKHFEEVGNGQWKPKESSDFKFTPEFVAYLNNAFRLREILYGKGAVPNFEYSVQLSPVKNAIVELIVDGNRIDSEGTRSGSFTFPARGNQETGVILQLTDNSAPPIATTTPSTATNANSSTPGATTTNTNAGTAANVNVIRNFAQSNTAAVPPASNQPLRYPGQWGIFRLVFGNNGQKNEAGEYVLNLTVQGKPTVIKIRPAGGDIFNREVFRSLRAPQEILR